MLRKEALVADASTPPQADLSSEFRVAKASHNARDPEPPVLSSERTGAELSNELPDGGSGGGGGERDQPGGCAGTDAEEILRQRWRRDG